MADEEVQPLSSPTANYGWQKPTVGADGDAWGGMLNADLDSIDATVFAKLSDAPNNTNTYGRKGGAWSLITAGVTVSDTAPSSPSPGALWWDSVGGQLYVYYSDPNTSQWVIAVNAMSALQPATTTTLGGVKVDGTSIQAAVDGTISTVLVPMGDNRIVNGDMRIDQRGVASGGGGTAVGYTVDRWQFSATLATKGTWNSSAFGLGFPHALSFSSNSAYTPLAGDTFCFMQVIEADMVSDFQWGTASAQPVTLSFMALCNTLTGTFSGSIRNAANTRSYPFTYSLPTVNTATKVAVTIPGDTSGSWVMSGNAGSVIVAFDMGTGATYRGPANAWAGTQYNGATGAVSVVSTNGAIFYVTGVKLEIGSIATPYNRQSLAKSLADCQRYYQTGQFYFNFGPGATAGGQAFSASLFHSVMRAVAAMTITTNSCTNTGAPALNDYSTSMFMLNAASSAAGAVVLNVNFTASAEL